TGTIVGADDPHPAGGPAKPEAENLGDLLYATRSTIGPAFPGPFGLLCADVLEGDLDVRQAEGLAASLLDVEGDAAAIENLSHLALTRAYDGDWAASVVLLRLLAAALENSRDFERTVDARAHVSVNLAAVAALALTSGADPELFSRALAAGRWAPDWATRGGHFGPRRRGLAGPTLLSLLPP